MFMKNNNIDDNKNLRTMPGKSIDIVNSTILGSGTVTAILGKGGFATVYEIWNPKLEIKRAVKLWHPNISQKSLERFETEIKITAKLHHPNIVEIHNVGEWNNRPYIEMEKITGASLKSIISERGALPIKVATAISILVCRALTYAHQQNYILSGIKHKGIVHCDIKPANIMITPRGVVKLTDFGLATPADETLHLDSDKISGSIHYSSPEQLQSIQVDQRTDIYSLGVVMYEMYSGIKAFTAKSLEDLLTKRINDIYTPFPELCHDINPAITKIVKKCMANDRDGRYNDAQELIVDIEKIFYKITKDTPEYVISRYFSNPEESTNSKDRKRKIILTVLTSFIFAAALVFTFFYIEKLISKTKTNFFTQSPPPEVTQNNLHLIANKDSTSSAVDTQSEPFDDLSLKNDSQLNKSIPKPIVTSTYHSKKRSTVNHMNSTTYKNKLLIETTRSEPVKEELVLQQLSNVIQKNDFLKADQIFNRQSINDGEYFFLYSQCLSFKGKWQEGLQSVEKGFRITSRRLTPEQHRSLYLYSKAKCLSSGFNLSRTKELGEKAMEAWYDVKYIYKSMPTNVQYIYADSEIRRINKALQNVPTN